MLIIRKIPCHKDSNLYFWKIKIYTDKQMLKIFGKLCLENPELEKEGRGKNYGRFLKMIDDLQTPKHKTNHKYRSRFPLFSFTY